MHKIYRLLFLLIFLLVVNNPTVANAKNNDVPFFNGDDATYLISDYLQLSGKLLRSGNHYTPPGAIKAHYYGYDVYYPSLYNGAFSWSNSSANLVKNYDYHEPFIRILNEGYFNSNVKLGDRMVTEVERMNNFNIYNTYWGNPEFVLENMIKHEIGSYGSPKKFGYFYWIRDIAYLSGGYAGTGVSYDVNPFSLFVVRTNWPEIRKFDTVGNSLSNPVNFSVEGYEYVSKNKGYTDNDPNSTTINPYQEKAGERNRVKWELVIEKGGKEVDRKEGYMRSEPWQDKQNPHEEDAGWFGGNGTSSPIRWQPQECGRYDASLQVWDSVQRESKVKKTSFTIDQDCNSEPPEPPTGGGETDDTFKYKIDFSVDRIEGETAEKGASISTPVQVSRKSFADERTQYRYELDTKIQEHEQNISNLENEKSTAQSNLSYCRYDKICYEDKDGEVHCYDRDCSSYENKLDSVLMKLDDEKKKKEKEKKKLKRLDDLEKKYSLTSPAVILKLDSNKVGSKTVTLSEGESTTLYFDWNLNRSGKLEAEINPSPRKYDNSKEVIKTTFSNNKLDTPIYTSSHEAGSCPKPGKSSNISGVVRTINDNGAKESLYEHFSAEIVNLTKKKLKAGYGFTYDIKTKYTNEDPKSNATGAKRTQSYFPTMLEQLVYPKVADGYKVPMERTNNSGSTMEWSLPKTYVEEFSGKVFDKDYKRHPDYNPSETILDGGRKWYTSFEQPDGKYPFKAMTYDAGVNKLNLCLTGEVEIQGSFIGDEKGNDDFIRRSVNPENPFPSKTGWNWNGQEEKLKALNEWWIDWKYPNPKDVPSQGYHLETYKITPENYKAIKEYNRIHGLDVSLNSNFFERFNLN